MPCHSGFRCTSLAGITRSPVSEDSGVDTLRRAAGLLAGTTIRTRKEQPAKLPSNVTGDIRRMLNSGRSVMTMSVVQRWRRDRVSRIHPRISSGRVAVAECRCRRR